jgi:hypothetical protein
MLATASLAALLFVAGASAATVRVIVSGSVQTTAVVGGDPSIGISLSGVEGGLTYAGLGTSTGTITQTYPAPPFPGATGPGASLSVFHGDVSQGCVRVSGNRTLVVGLLPANEQSDIPFGHMDGIGGLFEDNGVAGPSPVDRAAAIFYRTASRVNACDPTKPFPTFSPGALDSGDVTFGYVDRLDAYPANKDSDVTITDPRGLTVTITDAPDPEGLDATASAGSGFAWVDACGNKVKVNAGSSGRFTCASLIAETLVGSLEVELENGGTVVTIPQGGIVEVSDDPDGGSSIANLGTIPVTVTVDGVPGSIQPGETVSTWDFQGFLQPVDNLPTKNIVKAGAGVPLKWRLVNALNEPVTDLASATITISSLDCDTAVGSDEVEQTTTIGSGLQNLGDGYYQLNWKTQKSYAGTCKALHLDIGHGVTHDANFSFTK